MRSPVNKLFNEGYDLMGRLFGTDGVRGIANTDLTCELAMNIGRAAAHVLAREKVKRPKILIGKDTRSSSTMLESALSAGICSTGADVVLVGNVPTPAVAFLVSDCGADAGIMISASHNPCEYNGIKIFDSNGYKLPDEMEEEIESLVLDDLSPIPTPIGGDVGSIFKREDYLEDYIKHLLSTVNVDFSGLKIAIDCANGSAFYTAEKIFNALGAECYMLHAKPNGTNINSECGSTDMRDLVRFVNANGMDLGLAFDGDADRCLAVDEKGQIIDGDKLIAVFAKELKSKNKLVNNTAVVTVMTNIGFSKFAKDNDIFVEVTSVGDRYVLESMVKNCYKIGGEQSGHIIFKDYASTGDGQLTGIQFAAAMVRNNKTASELASVMTSFPQTMINVEVTDEVKKMLDTDKDIIKIIKEKSDLLGDSGRVLVRASGTEPLVRVMIEGSNIKEINNMAKEIAAVIESKV